MNKFVFVVGGDPSVEKMFEDHGWIPTSQNGLFLETYAANLVCFTGGADVHPNLYGELPDGKGHYNRERDAYETLTYHASKKIPMVGICRGGQFLHVMNGGKLIQHLGETRHGFAEVHELLEGAGSRLLPQAVHIDHHQGIYFPDPSTRGPVVHLFDKSYQGEEVVCTAFYQDTKSLCFQPHPEWGHKPTEEMFFSLIHQFLKL